MKKQAFVLAIESIKDQMSKDYEVGGLITNLGDQEFANHRFVFTTGLIPKIMDVLRVEFNDQYDYISYFIYDLNFGKEAEMLYITRSNGSKVKLYSAGHLYDWLMEANNEHIH